VTAAVVHCPECEGDACSGLPLDAALAYVQRSAKCEEHPECVVFHDPAKPCPVCMCLRLALAGYQQVEAGVVALRGALVAVLDHPDIATTQQWEGVARHALSGAAGQELLQAARDVAYPHTGTQADQERELTRLRLALGVTP